MRIGINGQLLRDRYGGIDYYIVDLVNSMARLCPENEYLVYADKRVFENDTFPRDGINRRATSFPNRIRSCRIIWEQMRLPSLLIRDQVDVLHAPGYIMPLAPGVPTVVTIPDVISFLLPRLCETANRLYFRLFLPAVSRRAGRIITMSESSRKDIIRVLGVDRVKIDVIHSGVHSSFVPIADESELRGIRAKYGLPDRLVLFVGKLEPKKNIVRIIQAFSLLKEKYAIPHDLVIVGPKGWLFGDIFKAVDELRLHRRVHFLGHVPRSDLPYLYNAADVFVFPSLYEGFGFPPLEAMACGTPVVTSSVSAIPEMVGDGALMVEPTDVGAISRAVYSILTEENLREELREKGRQRVKLFSWTKTARKTLGVYEECLAR
jgi:glycosyltransferase involved in cell wall biosynthesis